MYFLLVSAQVTCDIFTYEFLLMYFFTCVNSSFLPVIFLLVFFSYGFFCVNSSFLPVIFLLVIFSLMDLFFYTDFFSPPKLCPKRGEKFAFPRSLIAILRSIVHFSALHFTCVSHLPETSPKFTFKVIY